MNPTGNPTSSGGTAVSVVLLAAGYGTRLYPLTKDRPKALLPIGPRAMLDIIMDKVREIPNVRQIVLVTNHRFAEQFRQWQQQSGQPVEVIDDETSTNETRLGAIRDLQLGMERLRRPDDVVVLGTDNLFTSSLAEFVRGAKARAPSATVALQEVATKEDAKKFGIVELLPDGRIKRLLEKPADPPTRLAALCVYYFPHAMHPRFAQFLSDGGNPDAPGYFIEWLVRTEPTYGTVVDGEWFDIGSHETYREAVERWGGASSGKPSTSGTRQPGSSAQ